MIAGRHILLTGATGFVGTALVHALLGRGCAIVAAVRTPGSVLPDAVRQAVVGDLSAATDWRGALSGIDTVVHLAARVHVMDEKSSDPLAAFRVVNVDATLNLARQAVSCGVKRFVFVSSVKVNGEATTLRPFDSADVPAPVDPYGQSKLEAELALQALARETGLELVIIRPPLVYGPGVRANFANLMKLVKRGLPLPLGAVHNRRSMVALENLVDLIILCTHHRAAPAQIFMVSDDADLSIAELIRLIAAAMGNRPMLLPVPVKLLSGSAAMLGKGAVAARLLGSLQVDISHTKSTLDWRPIATVQDAVRATVAHFLTH